MNPRMSEVRRVEVLGPIRVEGAAITSQTQLLVLAVLAAARPTSVPFHRLIDAVWDDPPPSAENSLHSHLTRLRRALGAGAIVRDDAAYRLCSPTDADRFDSLVSSTSVTRHGRRMQLTEALGTWRGDPFGTHGDHPFVRGAADALVTRYCAARRELANLDLADGDPTAAVVSLRELVDAHPLDEASWAMLVEALDLSGRRAEALRTVQEAGTALAAVGLEPSVHVRDAEAAVLRESRATAGTPVPRAHGPLIGRARELDIVALATAGPGWTTLVGTGGAGKTRLAVEVASRASVPTSFADLSETTADEVELRIAQAVGTALREPYLDRVAGRLSAGPTLLVLDCCELAGSSLVGIGERLLHACPALRVLATSRTPVGVAGERLVEIGPLGEDAAGALLRLRAKAAGIDTPDDIAVSALCRAVDRIPLNVEVLAGALRSLSADELLDALDDPIAVLGGSGGGLVASVERSLSLLSDAERSTFERLSVFRGPFVAELVTACAPPEAERTTVEHLRTLRDRSLITPVDTSAGRRLRMLDTIRAVARAAFDDREDRPETERRYVTAMAERAARIGAGLRTSDEMRWLQIAESETVELRAAHQLAIEHRMVDAAMRIPASLYSLVYDRLRSDLAAWADESLAALGTDHPLAEIVLAVSALGAMHVDDHDRAWSRLEQVHDLVGSRSRHGALVAANLHLRDGTLRRTEAEAARVVDLGERHGDLYLATVGHVVRGLGASYAGDRERAEAIVRAARTLSRVVGAPTLLAYADYLDGEVRSDTEPAVALELLHRAHARAVACRSALAEGVSHVTITTIRARSPEPEGAGKDFATAIRHWRDRGDWNLQWSTLRNLVEFLARTGNHAPAAVLIGAIDAHGPAGFGAEAARYAEAVRRVEHALSEAETKRLRARGRSLTDDELLDHALSAAQGLPSRTQDVSSGA